MKKKLQPFFTTLFQDKLLLAIVAASLIVALFFAIWSITIISPQDAQLTTRYSMFGTTHSYKTKWYMLYSIPLAAMLFSAMTVVAVGKLLTLKRANVARIYAIVALVVVCIMVAHTYQLLNVAYS